MRSVNAAVTVAFTLNVCWETRGNGT